MKGSPSYISIADVQEDQSYYGENIEIRQLDEQCTVFTVKDSTGRGVMTSYKVFPGIRLIYNDFQMKSCFSEFRPNAEMLTIDYCREGRIECELQNGSYMYLDEGDLQISASIRPDHTFGFPLTEYNGITIGIYLDEALEATAALLAPFSIDLLMLREKFSKDDEFFLMRATESMRYIFSTLYTEQIRISFLRIKIIELLLLLSSVDISVNRENRPYFPKKQVDAVKRTMEYIRQHWDQPVTLQELSQRFDISQTAMKRCFKAIYGQPVYAYIRKHRIERAAYWLRHSDEAITNIAGRVGYSNPSKFAAAFKAVKGMSPVEYQKNVVRMEHPETDWSG
ncbi:helix-turn-helix domain-containing protein [Paenibacillus senegalensis]|uniref:helix-turn-helix domain-containing protein n=1 Tax=Paenibacillus senegalensis TaxID=1465766 RepID=UPI000288BAD4|nr:AraC family transcriptional regulator [Paenibacillus senegalensis]